MEFRPKSISEWVQSNQTYHVIISWVPECIIGIDILISWKKPVQKRINVAGLILYPYKALLARLALGCYLGTWIWGAFPLSLTTGFLGILNSQILIA